MKLVSNNIRVQQSEVWQTNTGVILDDDRAILVDPGVLAGEFAALLQALGGREIVAGFATHFHWDHILWPPVLGDAPRYAYEETCRLVGANREDIGTSLDGFEGHLAETYGLGPQWDRSRFFDLRPMNLGPGEIAGVSCELVDVSGHEDGQVALVLPEHDVAFVADTLSDIETPSITEKVERFGQYLETLDRLQGVIDRVSWIIPGHGAVADRAEAQRRLDMDRRYLESLPRMVAEASSDVPDDDLAREIAAELGDPRAADGLSWSMHLGNVRLIRDGAPH